MDAIDSFSEEAGDLMEEVYQHNVKVLSPRMKENLQAKSKQVCHYLLCFSLSFIVLLVLHYE